MVIFVPARSKDGGFQWQISFSEPLDMRYISLRAISNRRLYKAPFLYNCLWKRLFIHISFHWKIFSIGNLASLPLSAIEGSSLKKQIIYLAPQMFMPLLFCARICQDKLSGQNCFVAVISYQAAGEAWAETGYNWFNGWAIELTQRKYLAGSV